MPTVTRIHVRGHHHVPKKGAFLLVSNHLSMADPLCLLAYSPRRLHFMTKAEVFEQWPLNMILPPGEPIKVHRGKADLQALRQAEQYLKAGEPVMIFAEGTRSKRGEVQQARAGVVFLAQRTGVPIVPAAISGTEKLLLRRFPYYWRGEVNLTFGPPFYLHDLGTPTRKNRDEMAQAVMARVAALLPRAYQGSYAEQLKGEITDE